MPKITKAQKELRLLQRLEKKRRKAGALRGQYRDNLRLYMAEQNYVHRIHEYLAEIMEVHTDLKANNTNPLVDPTTGLVNEGYVDLESARVRIVALKTAIDVNFRLLNKILPDAKAEVVNPSPIDPDASKSIGETFLEALAKTEGSIEHTQRPKLLN